MLLLAIQPMRVLGVRLTGAAIGTIIGLAVLCILLAGMLRRDWSWYAGFVIQGLLIVAGFIFHISLTILGVLFLLLWIYVVSVRRTVLGNKTLVSRVDRAPRRQRDAVAVRVFERCRVMLKLLVVLDPAGPMDESHTTGP